MEVPNQKNPLHLRRKRSKAYESDQPKSNSWFYDPDLDESSNSRENQIYHTFKALPTDCENKIRIVKLQKRRKTVRCKWTVVHSPLQSENSEQEDSFQMQVSRDWNLANEPMLSEVALEGPCRYLSDSQRISNGSMAGREFSSAVGGRNEVLSKPQNIQDCVPRYQGEKDLLDPAFRDRDATRNQYNQSPPPLMRKEAYFDPLEASVLPPSFLNVSNTDEIFINNRFHSAVEKERWNFASIRSDPLPDWHPSKQLLGYPEPREPIGDAVVPRSTSPLREGVTKQQFGLDYPLQQTRVNGYCPPISPLVPERVDRGSRDAIDCDFNTRDMDRYPYHCKPPLISNEINMRQLDFDNVHCEIFGVTPTPSYENSEPPMLLKLDEHSSDNGYASTTNNSDDDTSEEDSEPTFSIYELLKRVHIIRISPYQSGDEDLNKFLDPHDVGHLNYLMKCYSDAAFSFSIPQSLLKGTVLSPINYLSLHMSAVFKVLYILFKCMEFRRLETEDKHFLLESNMIPILISFGLNFYNSETESWNIPDMQQNNSASFPVSSLLQIIPKTMITNIKLFYDVARSLNIDWTMSFLFTFIILYTPIDKEINNIDTIHRIRDKYVKTLFKYTTWKFGPQNTVALFPELLKLLDILLHFSKELNAHQLKLSDDEINVLQNDFSYMQREIHTVFFNQNHKQLGAQQDEQIGDKFSYSKFHSKLISILI